MSPKPTITGYIDLARPYNSVAALVPFAIGFLLGPRNLGYGNLYLGLAALVLVHSATTIQNDIYDQKIDRKNLRRSLLLNGALSVRQAWQYLYAVVLAAVLLVAVSDMRQEGILMIASLLLIGTAYNAPPWSLSRRPIASILILGIYYTAIPLLSGVLIGEGRLGESVLVLGLSLTLQKISVSVLKDYKDEPGDRQYHKQTFLIVYGRRAVAWSSLVAGLIGYVVTAWYVYSYSGSSKLWAVLLGVMVLISLQIRLKLFKARRLDKLAALFRRSFIADNYFNLLVLGCLAIS